MLDIERRTVTVRVILFLPLVHSRSADAMYIKGGREEEILPLKSRVQEIDDFFFKELSHAR